jgi:hypothetical protein
MCFLMVMRNELCNIKARKLLFMSFVKNNKRSSPLARKKKEYQVQHIVNKYLIRRKHVVVTQECPP